MQASYKKTGTTGSVCQIFQINCYQAINWLLAATGHAFFLDTGAFTHCARAGSTV